MKKTTLFFLIIVLNLNSVAFAKAKPTKSAGSEIECLMKAMYGEARGESEKGKLMVAGSLLERKRLGYLGGASVCRLANAGYAPKAVPASQRSYYMSLAKRARPNGITHFHSYPKQKDRRAASFTGCPSAGKIGGHWVFRCGRSRSAEGIEVSIPGLPEYDVAEAPSATTAI